MKKLYTVILAASAVLPAQKPDPKPKVKAEYQVWPEAGRSFHFSFAPQWVGDGDYRRGMSYLDKGEWDRAAERFAKIAAESADGVDAALYWQAYALNKAGRKPEAIAALERLKTDSKSRWLEDAKVLEAEVRSSSGRPVPPESIEDEDLKLYALASLVHNEPARALPLIQNMLSGTAAPKLKSRALIVLTQIRTPEARALLVRIAKGGANPDLQRTAVQYLGEMGGAENLQTLSEIYASTSDPLVRRAVLFGYRNAKDTAKISAVLNSTLTAASDGDKLLRREAARALASAGGHDQLWAIYTSGKAPADGKAEILGAMGSRGLTPERAAEVLRQEKDAKVRRMAINALGNYKPEQTSAALLSAYAAETDKEVKDEVIDALADQGNAAALVSLARRETDRELKRTLVRTLSRMKSKEATDYLAEFLTR